MALEMGKEAPSQEGKPMDTEKVLAPQKWEKMGVFYGYPDTALWEPNSETAKKCLSRMSGNTHVRFLGEKGRETAPT